MGLSISSRLIVSGKHPLFWVVSCGRINLVLCLALLKGFILDVWELRKVQRTTDPVSDCIWGDAECRWWKG